jgi:pyruvate dehydrogenase E1 component
MSQTWEAVGRVVGRLAALLFDVSCASSHVVLCDLQESRDRYILHTFRTERELSALSEIERRVLWLAVRMVDHANHDRPSDVIKTGGHQASSASLATAMTALWFGYLKANDRVSVKPHASPVLHAINYLLGDLDGRYLTELRAFGGLQAYPSRTKDPDRVDFSTGSVGLGAAAPLFAAAARRYIDAHFGSRSPAKFIALLGDAELDEGNVWEAINEPATAGLGNVMWIVDFNRQSLDRVVPGVRIAQWSQQFAAAGWHVVEAKYVKSTSRQPVGPEHALNTPFHHT